MTSQPELSGVTRTIHFRQTVTPADAPWVRAVVQRTGVFSPAEVDVAVELVDERLAKGLSSGYHFLFAEHRAQPVGYVCYGPIAVTSGSFDLYWIVVDPSHQHLGVGSALLAETEQQIGAAGGRQIYVETSGRSQYQPARAFYERHGYQNQAILPDFYAPGDSKLIYVKAVFGTSLPKQGS